MMDLQQRRSPSEVVEFAAYLLLIVLTAFLPLVYIPQAVDSFVLSKEAIFQVGVSLLVGLLVVMAFLRRPVRIPAEPINGALLLFLLWKAISIIWAASPQLALEEVWRWGFLILYALAAQGILANDRRRIIRIIQALLASTLILATWVIVQDFRAAFFPESLQVRQVLGDWRDMLSTVAMGNTSHIADMLALGFLGWLASIFVIRPRMLKILALGALFLHAGALIVVWSVHSNLSVVIAVAVFFWAMRYQWATRRPANRWVPLATAALIGWALIVSFYVVDHPLNPHGSAVWAEQAQAERSAMGLPEEELSGGIFAQAFSSPRWVSGLDTRLAIWYNTMEIARQHLLLGGGAGSLTWLYPATMSPIVANNPDLAQYGGSWTNAAHNSLMQLWAELGILGPIFLLLFFGLTLKTITDRLNGNPSFGNAILLSGILALLTAQLVQMQMNFPLQLPTSSMIFLLLLTLPHLLPHKGNEERPMYMPVERDYGPVTLGVVMKNMAYPTEIRLRLSDDAPNIFSIAGAIMAGGVALIAAWMALVPLRADIAFREVREGRDRFNAGLQDATKPIAAAEDVLAIWPGHVDCRSAMQELLLASGQFDRVLEETPLVLKKLNAIEVYLRRAMALESLGRGEEAVSDWDVIFGRRPEVGRQFPRQYNQWLARQPHPNQTS